MLYVLLGILAFAAFVGVCVLFWVKVKERYNYWIFNPVNLIASIIGTIGYGMYTQFLRFPTYDPHGVYICSIVLMVVCYGGCFLYDWSRTNVIVAAIGTVLRFIISFILIFAFVCLQRGTNQEQG